VPYLSPTYYNLAVSVTRDLPVSMETVRKKEQVRENIYRVSKTMRRIALIAVLLIASVNAQAVETVKVFKGTGNTTTAIFTVEAPWLLDWNLNGDYDAIVALDVTLVEAHTGRHVGRILHTKRKGNGLQLFDQAGKFQLRISSTLARWTLKVQQLEPEEKELYTPRKPK
jgi:hypothetical protein